ncbi:MAG: hypothetical protein AB8E15_09650 [Bdellovibrionales bacterium]
MFLKFLGIGLLIASLSSCTSFRRSVKSGYTDLSPDQYTSNSKRKNTIAAKYELGVNDSNSLSTEQAQVLNKRVYLKHLEESLISDLERQQYYQNKPFFFNDDERIEFLRLSDYSDRDSWLARKQFDRRSSRYSKNVEEAIQQNDVILHMSMKAVKESWGEPDLREVSGNQVYGNERWVYKSYRLDQGDYQEEKRVLLFQSGKVVAWQTR